MNIFTAFKLFGIFNTAKTEVSKMNTQGKPWYDSLTYIFNGALIPVAAVTGITDAGQAWVAGHPAVAAVLTLVVLVANLFLRGKTNTPIR